MNIVGLMAPKDSGKSTVARLLDDLAPAPGVTTFGIADPFKDLLVEVYGWPRDAMYGPSSAREAVCPHGRLRADGVPLTHRHAGQQLGVEAVSFYPTTWIDYAITRAEMILGRGVDPWTKRIFRTIPMGVVIEGVRLLHDAEAIRREDGAVWFIDRPSAEASSDGHATEQEMLSPLMREHITRFVDNAGDGEGRLRGSLAQALTDLGWWPHRIEP